jgi:hypothetical protein
MQKLSTRKQNVLEILNEEIEALEEKLAKAQPLIDELAQLKKTRATLLSERSQTGSIGGRTQLTMEMVVHAFNGHNELTVPQIAEETGVGQTVVRSHLNRYRDTRYEQTTDGNWRLIGAGQEE